MRRGLTEFTPATPYLHIDSASDTTYTLGLHERVVYVDNTTAAVTVTLPPVSEAAGLIFCITNINGTQTTTVVDNNDDSFDWADATLDVAKDGAMYRSDGKKWWLICDNI